MNGFSAADMSTAAANGHAEGYQAGYADAVKAVEVGKPAAAQEAVARRSIEDVIERARDAIFGAEATPASAVIDWIEAELVNAAPVAAAPVDLPTPRSREKFIKAIEGMSVSVDVDRLFDTDGRRLFGTVTTVQHDDGDKHGLTLLVQDAQPNWEESTPASPVDAIKRLQEAIEGELDGLSVDYKTAESILAHTFHVPPLNIKGAAEVARVIGYEFDNDGTGEGLKDLEVIVKAASTPAAPGIDLATAWAEGYRSGVTDERISESNIGIAGFGAKIEPARANPYMIDASPKGGSTDAPKYTTGHCENHNKPGGCQLHNLQCGYPKCDRKQATSAEVGA